MENIKSKQVARGRNTEMIYFRGRTSCINLSKTLWKVGMAEHKCISMLSAWQTKASDEAYYSGLYFYLPSMNEKINLSNIYIIHEPVRLISEYFLLQRIYLTTFASYDF